MTNISDMPLTVHVSNGQINITLDNDLTQNTYTLSATYLQNNQYKQAIGTSTINITQSQTITGIDDLPKQTIYVGEMVNGTDATIYTGNGGEVLITNIFPNDELDQGEYIYFIVVEENTYSTLLLNDGLYDLPIDQDISVDDSEVINELFILYSGQKSNTFYLVALLDLELWGIPPEMEQITNNAWNITLQVQQP